jgi:hypothetical protein
MLALGQWREINSAVWVDLRSAFAAQFGLRFAHLGIVPLEYPAQRTTVATGVADTSSRIIREDSNMRRGIEMPAVLI